MNERLKALAEIAGIELAYARAEVELVEPAGEEHARIVKHLEAASAALDLILSGFEELDLCERIAATHIKDACPARSDKAGEPFWKR
jgi:hypothetical protein